MLSDEAFPEQLFQAADLVHSYSRQDAIDDGTLYDISSVAREAGIRFPCAVPAAVWSDLIEWSEHDTEMQGTVQDQAGRLWDVAWMLRNAAATTTGPEMLFSVYAVPRNGRTQTPVKHRLRVVCGPGDTVAPVITVMMPYES